MDMYGMYNGSVTAVSVNTQFSLDLTIIAFKERVEKCLLLILVSCESHTQTGRKGEWNAFPGEEEAASEVEN